MLDPRMHGAAVDQRDPAVDLLRLHRAISRRDDLRAQRQNNGVAHRPIAELLFAGNTLHQGDRDRMIDTELSVQSRVRRLLAGEFEYQRIDLERDAVDLVNFEPEPVAQLDRGIDGRVENDATRERLVRIEQRLVSLAEFAGDFAKVLPGTDRAR